jgi:ferredoxin
LLSGYRELCQELDIRLLNLKEMGFREVRCQGKVLRKTYISRLVLDADFILNLPKLKTHSFTMYTGAIKNFFGVIPHGLRHQYHRHFQRNDIFSEMLVDIFSCVRPHLTIMDAVAAMEGEGPSAGNIKKVGLILASCDAVALDAIATFLIGLNPLDVPTTRSAQERSLGKGKISEIEVLGENLDEVRVKNFKHSAVAVSLLQRKIPSFLYAILQDQLTLIPEVSRKKCTACGECVKICPIFAARFQGGVAGIEKKRCIHCMCCHEVCQDAAIKLKQRPLGRFIRVVSALVKKIQSALS